MLLWTLVYRHLLSSCFSSFGYVLRSGIARSYDNSVFNLLRNRHIVFHSSCTILTSGLWFLYILANTRHFPFFVFFLIVTMLMGMKWQFWFCIPLWLMMLNNLSLHILIAIFIFWGEISIQVFCLFFELDYLFFTES